MIEIKPQVYFGKRELDSCPPHFVKATTPINSESLIWVKNKLQGRYSLMSISDNDMNNFIFAQKMCIFFEDSGEAMMYELRWSGSK